MHLHTTIANACMLFWRNRAHMTELAGLISNPRRVKGFRRSASYLHRSTTVERCLVLVQTSDISLALKAKPPIYSGEPKVCTDLFPYGIGRLLIWRSWFDFSFDRGTSCIGFRIVSNHDHACQFRSGHFHACQNYDQHALITSLAFVHTFRRYYRSNGSVRPSDQPKRGRQRLPRAGNFVKPGHLEEVKVVTRSP